MYYSEYDRVKKTEKLLERLAYISVGLDFVIALASLLVLRGAAFSGLMLTISGDLILIEMIVVSVIFVTLMALKHYSNIMDSFAGAAFKNVKIRKVRRTFRRVLINPFVLLGKLFSNS